MSGEQPERDDDEEQQQQEADKSREGREQSQAMNRMTDMPETEKQLDANKVQQAMAALAATKQADRAAQLKRERELASVKISKEDVEVLAEQAEVDAKQAERRLRESGGDLAAALRSYLLPAA